MDNSDARSVYSVNSRAVDDNDDTMSVASGHSRATYRDDPLEGGASTVDTLVRMVAMINKLTDTQSFSSEPVLTPHELNIMGQETVGKDDIKANNPYMKRRGMLLGSLNRKLTIWFLVPGQEATLPYFEQGIDWHSKFIEILDTRCITEDQFLQKGNFFLHYQ